MDINMTGQAIRKLFMHVAAMWLAVAGDTFGYHLMLALMTVDTEQVVMFSLICG